LKLVEVLLELLHPVALVEEPLIAKHSLQAAGRVQGVLAGAASVERIAGVGANEGAPPVLLEEPLTARQGRAGCGIIRGANARASAAARTAAELRSAPQVSAAKHAAGARSAERRLSVRGYSQSKDRHDGQTGFPDSHGSIPVDGGKSVLRNSS